MATCFFEHIPAHEPAMNDMPRWWTLEQVTYMKQIFSYIVGEEGYARILERFATATRNNDVEKCRPWMGGWMTVTVSSLGEWEFSVDRAATVEAHARQPAGGADSCTCNACRNFVAARERVFPAEFLVLLDSLGIDWRKDGEAYIYGPTSTGLYLYGGWFHFVGTLDKTGDFPTVPMGEAFKVWLCRGNAPPLATMKHLPRVQLEFEAEVPWELNEDAPV